MNSTYSKTLEFIRQRLSRTEISWAIIGGANHAIQGIDLIPNDIDIISDKKGIDAIEKIFIRHIVLPVRYSVLQTMRSYYGMMRIDSVNIDLIADIENKLESGIWECHIDWEKHIELITFNKSYIPVLSLEYEYSIYKKLGKLIQAQKILKKIEARSHNNSELQILTSVST